jgi:predicted O-linked N-acetylglucosamine transferase (SPINDLY family)
MAGGEFSTSEMLRRAIAFHGAGDLPKAEHLYRSILNEKADHAAALHFLGVIEFQQGRAAEGIRLIDQALAFEPEYVAALIDRGNILSALERLEEARASYDQALLLKPDDPNGLYNRGCSLQRLGRQEDALADYDQALAIRPNFAEALNNRGNVLLALGRMQQALQSYDRALAIRPGNLEALSNRGSVLNGLGRPEEALECFDQALAIKPDHTDALYNRGNALLAMGRWQAARECYSRVLAINTDHGGAKFARCMAELPILYADEAEIAERRAAYDQRLTALCKEVARHGAVPDLSKAVGFNQPFYLAYQGQNDRDLQAKYGSLVCRIMAARYPPLPLPAAPGPDEPVRVGIVSGFFKLHSNWKLHTKGTVNQLDRRSFRVFGYHAGTQVDSETKIAAAACDRFVQGPQSIDEWRQAILADAPHVLIYPEIGMDPVAAALAAQRLAAVQCTRFGHPVTSGFPTIDYFLSSDLMEPPNGQEHYTERLVRLPNLSFYYEPLDVPQVSLTRPELGLRPNATVYWCGQSLFKYLPQFDSVFVRIARDAGDCQFAFIQYSSSQYSSGASVTELFKQRLERAFASANLRAEDYCVFLPRLDFPKFISVFSHCDVILDSIGWSGNNTTMESLAHPLPIVTMTAPLMRGRHTMAILKMMGITETITETIDEYVSVAVRLARDAPWRMAIKERMLAAKNKVLRDQTSISGLEEFLNRVARPRCG